MPTLLGPDGNPIGRSDTITAGAASSPIGVGGTVIINGWLQNLELDWRLSGRNRWRTYSEMLVNTSIVAAGIRYFLDLCSKPKWNVKPPEGMEQDSQAIELAEFVKSSLYDIDSRSWVKTVRKAAEFRFQGFGLQELTAKRRDDGRLGVGRIDPRPQHTIERWDADEQGNIFGVMQRSPTTAQTAYIPRSRLVHIVDETMNDSPEGLGVLRHILPMADRLNEYMRLEQVGFATDLRGVPLGRAPLNQINEMVAAGKISKAQAAEMKQPMTDFITRHVRNESTGYIIDSSPYMSQGQNPAPSGDLKWNLELLQGAATTQDAINTAINRVMHDIAALLGVENILLGSGGHGGGSRALSQDKSEHIYLVCNAVLGDVAESFEHDYIGFLWTINGLPDKYRPRLKAEDVSFKDVTEMTGALRDMAQAGAILAPNDPAINDIRAAIGVSHAPEMDDATAAAIMGVRAGLPKPGDQGQNNQGDQPGGGKPPRPGRNA